MTGGPREWRGELELSLGLRAGRTRVTAQRHVGPLAVQRAFHPEGDGTAHVVVVHPPGGLVGGDHLTVRARVGVGARALLTTPGATKVYRTLAPRACTTSVLQVEEGADLEHVPQETVVFDGAEAVVHTRVELAATSRFLGWEVVCLGRPASDESFRRGTVRLSLEVWREGTLVFVERGRIEGDARFANAPWGLGGAAAFGTLVATDGEVDAVRRALEEAELEEVHAVTEVSGLLVVRVLGRDGPRARATLERARHRIRESWGRPAIDPAIWRS